ncbi:forespore capture DNA-binding protein RefZ [Bacillus timonensis]|nr:forespore capture DNA-binding protein RefZ [Bacillus timonensis]
MKTEKTKLKIIDAAIHLFNTKGYEGTSIREIAKRANVNVANISYYFENKSGLLEELVSTFLEDYIRIFQQSYEELEDKSARECLLRMIKKVMAFQRDNRRLAQFVLREITLDTILVREVMTTYLAKEKYYLKSILDRGIQQHEFRKIPVLYTFMQLKGMLNMPYINSHYMAEVLHIMPGESYFTEQYVKELEKWVNDTICMPVDERKPIQMSLPISV